jgi:hypothetical protein
MAQSFDTDFQPTTTYKSTPGTSGPDAGNPIFPLASDTGLTDPSGQTLQTIPFFATDAAGTHDYDGTITNSNIQQITIPSVPSTSDTVCASGRLDRIMATRKRHRPEQVVRNLTTADRLLSEGKDVAAVCRKLGISEPT